MGDEVHNRAIAASSLFANAVAPGLVKSGISQDQLLDTLGYVGNHPLLFLGLSMASGKSAADPARGMGSTRLSPPWRATAPNSAFR